MYQQEDSEERACSSQLNSALQHAHLELLDAHCATHQLRLHYSSDDLIRFGRRDVLRKSAQAACALHEYYAAIEKKIPPEARPEPPSPNPTGEQVAKAVEWLAAYLRGQRDHYLPATAPLQKNHKAALSGYFATDLLDSVRMIELKGARVPVPDFFAHVRSLGFHHLPEISHMDSLTFLDVIVFNELLTERALFHALVHTVQLEALGIERYAELWVAGFVRTRTHFTVPLEVHAFALTEKFLRPNPMRFSVEEHVRFWIDQNRY
jgi:hypothetical protein